MNQVSVFEWRGWLRKTTLLISGVLFVLVHVNCGQAFSTLPSLSGSSGLSPSGPSSQDKAVHQIVGGAAHTCALIADRVACWGVTGSSVVNQAPTAISTLQSGVQAIAAGQSHTCAIVSTASGSAVKCWGSNSYGQLGDGSQNDSNMLPVDVVGLSSGVQAISAGGFTTCAVVNGGVKCWGWNVMGQLGNNSTIDSAVPVDAIAAGSGATEVSVSLFHVCAIVSGGAKCWGTNASGQIGDGTQTETHVPLDVTGLPVGIVEHLAAGTNHTCAVVTGAAFCWGNNGWGELGVSAGQGNSLTPLAVSGLGSGVQAIASSHGGSHDETCVIVNGGVKCWGAGFSGKLGNGDVLDQATPQPVTGLASGFTTLGVGDSHVCSSSGPTIQCWGSNSSYQLGDGTQSDSMVPVSAQVF